MVSSYQLSVERLSAKNQDGDEKRYLEIQLCVNGTLEAFTYLVKDDLEWLVEGQHGKS